ncbi:DUF1542 domain-containing protein, partial [Streptococcus sp. NLN64]|uniref:DUF1542 domain-containing protein n=1 Tax=Streptococcus sp. NLN64 TaxID=2822799 RepID=UPI0018CA4761
EEKSAAKSEVDTKADQAKQAIDTATTNDGVTSAKDAGVTDINSVNPSPVAKEAAKAAIDEAAQAKKSKIDARSDLTDEEKATAKSEVDTKATAAKKAIDLATTNAGVSSAKDAGVTDINSVNPSPVAKEAAKAAVDDAVKDKKAEIDSRSDLTDEEKLTAKSEVDSKANEAKKAIDLATTNDGVTSAKDAGVSDINSVNPSPVTKDAAKKAIDDAAQVKKDEIDARTDLTDEERSAAKSQVDIEAGRAKSEIDAATSNAAVTSAKDAGFAVIEAINPIGRKNGDKPATKPDTNNGNKRVAGSSKVSNQETASSNLTESTGNKSQAGQLPNTGEESSQALAASGLALILLLAGVRSRRKKEDEK